MEQVKPDFNKAYECACEILVFSEAIKKFPFSPIKLIGEMDIRLISYSMAEVNLEIPVNMWKSKDAELREVLPGLYVIFYNDTIYDNTRVGFSLLHELGHFYLNHDMHKLRILKEKNLDAFEALYNKYELEANFFAAQLLMPRQIINKFIKSGCKLNENFLMKNFGVSKHAASIRVNFLRNTFEKTPRNNDVFFDDIILLKYERYINSIAPNKRQIFSLENEYDKQKERDAWI